MRIALLTLFLTIIFSNCREPQSDPVSTVPHQVHQKAQEFFATFSERSDWEKFCSFYRTDLIFEDIMLQLHLDSLWQFKRFYKWDEEGDRFKKLSPEQDHLTLSSLVSNDSIAVGTGRINPFYYDDQLIDTDWGMNFTIWLHFDKDLKIIKQIDWMEYDPSAMESVIKRCRENGHDATPAWLDLSRK